MYICITDPQVMGSYLARILQWVAMPFSRGSSQSRKTQEYWSG